MRINVGSYYILDTTVNLEYILVVRGGGRDWNGGGGWVSQKQRDGVRVVRERTLKTVRTSSWARGPQKAAKTEIEVGSWNFKRRLEPGREG